MDQRVQHLEEAPGKQNGRVALLTDRIDLLEKTSFSGTVIDALDTDTQVQGDDTVLIAMAERLGEIEELLRAQTEKLKQLHLRAVDKDAHQADGEVATPRPIRRGNATESSAEFSASEKCAHAVDGSATTSANGKGAHAGDGSPGISASEKGAHADDGKCDTIKASENRLPADDDRSDTISISQNATDDNDNHTGDTRGACLLSATFSGGDGNDAQPVDGVVATEIENSATISACENGAHAGDGSAAISANRKVPTWQCSDRQRSVHFREGQRQRKGCAC